MITFGVIGTANIVHRFLRGASKCKDVCVAGVASREYEKAKAFTAAYPQLTPYASYDALFEDKTIDAIYIATPNFTHEALVMQALAHGKHVLCEKPMMLQEASVMKCFAYAKQQGLLLMEAMKPAFLPTTLQAKAWITDGEIGTLTYISASYCHCELTPFLDGWHHEPFLGGGVLYDIGVYPIGFVHAVLEDELTLSNVASRSLENGCDIFHSIHCKSGNIVIDLLCGCDTRMNNRAILCGTKGMIEINDFWKSDAALLHKQEETTTFTEPHDQSEFQYQIQSFCDSILHHELENSIMSEAMSKRNARLVDQIRKKGDQR